MPAISNPSTVSGQILTDVVSRLSNPDIGFNTQLPVVIGNNARYTANASWLTNNPLQFPGDYTGQSPNVVLAPVALGDWMGTSPTMGSYNLLMQIFTISAIYQPNPTYREIGRLFDGLVNIGIHCHILWPNSQVVYDFDAPVSAVEDTMYTIFNTNTTAYQIWSHGTIYNGVLSCPQRSALALAATGWAQLSTFTIQFGLIK